MNAWSLLFASQPITCPSCGCADRWEAVFPVERCPEDPVTIQGVELLCDCSAVTVLYLDAAEIFESS